MVGESSKKQATEAYKALIDSFVEQAKEFGHAPHVRSKRIFSKAPAHRRFNTFIRSLSAEQRALLADMLYAERRGAIHDILAEMSWRIECKDLALVHRKSPMPRDLSGMGLHGDFVGRMDDWPWPQNGG